ncbi:hypothetical protein UFOVP223_37 [uncultured Caudovirales phage]|uniref:Uncharacterized protein n=1 Tax=uncultured Caudovirales phage TaxID=2100421 RepID=A0A6J7WN35_9CAUD|nr:hypothetical protein UFOVP110_127 [uncultured Caudovirales phage]CAB5219187.1 hypothetical protein UFOVP223_37 [uncultured Caudovirales phage]
MTEQVSTNPDTQAQFEVFSAGYKAGVYDFQEYLIKEVENLLNHVIDYALGENYDRLKSDILKLIKGAIDE